MGLNIGRGIRAAATYMRDSEERALADEQREYVRSQRAYQAGQQQRTIDEQRRTDALRDDLAAIPAERTVDYRNPDAPLVDDDGETPAAGAMSAAVAEKIPQDVQLRQAAAAFQKAGDWANALKHQQEADKIGWDRSSKMYQQVAAAALANPDMSTKALADQIAGIFTKDPFGGAVQKVEDDGRGGVVVQVTNRETGQAATVPFADKKALLEWAHAHYSPSTFAALQAQRQAALLAQSKPVTVKPGEQVVVPATGKVLHSNNQPPKGYEDVTLPTGETVRRPIARAAKPADPVKELNDAWELAATKGETKLTPQQLVLGKRIADQIFTENAGKVPPAVAVEAAMEIALDPSKQEPAIDLATGKIKSIYNHPQTGEFVISHLPPRDLKPEQMQLAVKKLIASMPKEDADKFTEAIKSEDASARMLNAVLAEIDGAIERDAAASPQRADQIRAQGQLTRKATAESLERKLQLGRQYGQQEKPASKSWVADVVDRTFGGGTSAAQDRLRVRGIRSAVAANPLRPQVQPDDEDLAVRASRAERATKPVDPAAREAKLASLKRLDLTPDKIRAMRPSEAKAIVDQYDDVLDAKTLFALRRAAS